MSTQVATKKNFIKMLESMDDDQILVFTTDLYGSSMAASKKIPLIRLPFAFAGDAFKRPNSLNPFMQNPSFAVILLPKEELSKHAISLTEVNKRHKLKKEPEEEFDKQ